MNIHEKNLINGKRRERFTVHIDVYFERDGDDIWTSFSAVDAPNCNTFNYVVNRAIAKAALDGVMDASENCNIFDEKEKRRG